METYLIRLLGMLLAGYLYTAIRCTHDNAYYAKVRPAPTLKKSRWHRDVLFFVECFKNGLILGGWRYLLHDAWWV